MEIVNCKKCGRIYAKDGFDRCPKCRDSEDELFKKVKEYLYEHPGDSVQKVSEETGVDIKKIMRYLREGRLEIREDGPNLLLGCERCGKPIRSGRFCPQCINEMQKEFSKAVAPKENDRKGIKKLDRERMYTAERRKR